METGLPTDALSFPVRLFPLMLSPDTFSAPKCAFSDSRLL